MQSIRTAAAAAAATASRDARMQFSRRTPAHQLPLTLLCIIVDNR